MDDLESGAKAFSLGILFIHGIGTQKRGETLAAFGGPFFRWLEARCEALGRRRQQSGVPLEMIERLRRKLEELEWSGISPCPPSPGAEINSEALVRRVVLSETKLNDPSDPTAPAHSTVTVLAAHDDESVSVENWLLAESWWANNLYPPSFSDLAGWGFRIVPWIVGSHFAAQVQRRLGERPKGHSARDVWTFAGWMWRLAAAIGGLAVGLLSTVLTMPLLALMLVVGAIPVPKIRSMLLSLQLRLAASLGDCYVLLARPIEESSIVSEVRQDLLWLSTRCSEVAIVAHSQGGAVAHLALRGTIPRELRLLFTFGSGLRKLQEADQLTKSGSSFARSSVLTSIALVILLLCAWLLTTLVVTDAHPSGASILSVLLWAIGAGAVCVAGIWDHLRGIRLPELCHWIKWLRAVPLRWVDCFASADPVPNGIILPCAKDLSREVCNRSSMLDDHTAYWTNLDEFVSLMYDEIARSRLHDPLPDLGVGESRLKEIADRRRWRVAIGRFIWWSAAAGVLAVVAHRWSAWQGFASWAWRRGGAWLADAFGMQAGVATPRLSSDWLALGLLATVVLTYGVARRIWISWNESEMRAALGRQPSAASSAPVLTAMWFLLVLISGLIAGAFPAYWVVMLCFMPSFVFIFREPRSKRPRGQAPDNASPASAASDSEERSKIDKLVWAVIGVVAACMWPFALGLSAWEALTWLAAHLSGGIVGGFRPNTISSYTVGGVTVIIWLAAWAVWAIWTGSASKTAPPDPS
jgi:hypothetical protein